MRTTHFERWTLGLVAAMALLGGTASPGVAKATAQATFAGGCFWSMEAAFEQLRGVEAVVSGYSGGATAHPSYEAVCTGATGHAEAILISYDPAVISYDTLLKAYFTIVDPTTLNRQGADAGTQYRSGIFTSTPAQAAAARKAIQELEARKAYRDPIVTTVSPLKAFYPAEAYHQDYYREHRLVPYSLAVIAPKVGKLRHAFPHSVK